MQAVYSIEPGPVQKMEFGERQVPVVVDHDLDGSTPLAYVHDFATAAEAVRWRAMNLVIPSRFSRGWWLVIGAATLVIGVAVFLVLRFGTTLSIEQVIIYWLVATFVGDVITAISMEAVAPTRVTIGPGDRRYDADHPAELAVVVSDFDDSGHGRVRVRGEVWRAMRAADDHTRLSAGTQVRVVDRDGLTLVVSSDTS